MFTLLFYSGLWEWLYQKHTAIIAVYLAVSFWKNNAEFPGIHALPHHLKILIHIPPITRDSNTGRDKIKD